jgi:hypothetical protein
MLRLFQEILHIYAQHVIFLLTLAQLMIFAAMGSWFRGKRDAAPRFIAGVLQLFVINCIAWYSALWGFLAFVVAYVFSFVWHYLSRQKIPDQFGDASSKTAAVAELKDETGDEGLWKTPTISTSTKALTTLLVVRHRHHLSFLHG